MTPDRKIKQTYEHGDLVQTLSRNQVFGSIDSVALDLLASVAQVRNYKAGDTIIVQGELGATAYVVIDGSVKIYRTSADGERVELVRRYSGQMFGELALLDGGPRTASVEAVTNASLITIERDLFVGVLERDPTAVNGILSWLGFMVRENAQLNTDLSLLDVRRRLARRLSVLLDHAPDGELTRHHRVTQKELAEMVGASRQSVNGALKSLESDGLIRIDVDGIRVVEADALSNLFQ